MSLCVTTNTPYDLVKYLSNCWDRSEGYEIDIQKECIISIIHNDYKKVCTSTLRNTV